MWGEMWGCEESLCFSVSALCIHEMNHFKSLLHPVLASACNCGHSSIKSEKEQESERGENT